MGNSQYLAGGHHMSTSTHSAPSGFGATANCPTGTSFQADGTCLAGSGYNMASRTSVTLPNTYVSAPASGVTLPNTYTSSAVGGVTLPNTYNASAVGGVTLPNTYAAGQEYRGGSVPPLSTRFMRTSGDMNITNSGSGNVTATYTDNSYSSYTHNNTTVVPFSTGHSGPLSSSYSLPGLGASESLSPTSCPVNVYNPEGGRVLGCYAVSRPAPVQQVHYTRVVRPVIYVRYPVPTAVPYTVNVPYPVYVGNSHCGGNTRYGAGWPRGCGY